MTVTVRDIAEVNDEAYVPDRSIQDRKVLEDLLRIQQVLRTIVAYLKFKKQKDKDDEYIDQLNLVACNYEVAQFRLPNTFTQAGAIPKRIYLFKSPDNILAFWSPDVSKWITLAQF